MFKVSKPADMFTICGVLTPGRSEKEAMVRFMRVFQTAKRTCYQAIRHDEDFEVTMGTLQGCFIANARWCQWAFDEAMDVIHSQMEFVDTYIHDLEAKLGKSRDKLKVCFKRKKRRGIINRISKLEIKLTYWKEHKRQGTVPAAGVWRQGQPDRPAER